MEKFFKTTDSWINKFGCAGLLVKLSKEEPEVVITKEGTKYKVNTVPIDIDSYYLDEKNGRVIKITLYSATFDSTDIIDFIPNIIKSVNDVRIVESRGQVKEMSSEEANWIKSCIKTFEERD